MKNDKLVEHLMYSIRILKAIRAQNVETNKTIDVFLEELLKDLQKKEEPKSEEGKEKPVEPGNQGMRPKKMKEEIYDMSQNIVKVPGAITSAAEILQNLVGRGLPQEKAAELIKEIENITGTPGSVTVEGMGGSIGTPSSVVQLEKDMKAAGKVWCAVCEEFHESMHHSVKVGEVMSKYTEPF